MTTGFGGEQATESDSVRTVVGFRQVQVREKKPEVYALRVGTYSLGESVGASN